MFDTESVTSTLTSCLSRDLEDVGDGCDEGNRDRGGEGFAGGGGGGRNSGGGRGGSGMSSKGGNGGGTCLLYNDN